MDAAARPVRLIVERWNGATVVVRGTAMRHAEVKPTEQRGGSVSTTVQ